jgi:hypothetical protein
MRSILIHHHYLESLADAHSRTTWLFKWREVFAERPEAFCLRVAYAGRPWSTSMLRVGGGVNVGRPKDEFVMSTRERVNHATLGQNAAVHLAMRLRACPQLVD